MRERARLAWSLVLVAAVWVDAQESSSHDIVSDRTSVEMLVAQSSASLQRHDTTTHDQNSTSSTPSRPCLALSDLFITLALILLILLTVFGNVLVILSVCLYKRMRTFTNLLLTSLAVADLLVGLLIAPMALVDLLLDHKWPFERLLCGIWATTDILLCTASILNLCVISLDRYLAITNPLQHPRKRSPAMATGWLCIVWTISLIVCTPPWFIPGWGVFVQSTSSPTSAANDFMCVYSPSVPYRIYSASCSFYIPLIVMLYVYFKIYRVTSAREKMLRQTLGTCRLSRRADKTRHTSHPPRHASLASAASAVAQQQTNGVSRVSTRRERDMSFGIGDRRSTTSTRLSVTNHNRSNSAVSLEPRSQSTVGAHHASRDLSLTDLAAVGRTTVSSRNGEPLDSRASCSDLIGSGARKAWGPPSHRNSSGDDERSSSNGQLQLKHLIGKAHNYYSNGPGKASRNSKEKIVYLRERKALKTIGVVVIGFLICWLPFFVLYVAEVYMLSISSTRTFQRLSDLFLWLGYSNSSLNPLIYTFVNSLLLTVSINSFYRTYNCDFRRCFRDLLGLGCLRHRRSMSVRKLHQQSTIF